MRAMRIAVLGATGAMGSLAAGHVRRQGHECVELSRSAGVDAYTGDGLRTAFDGVDAVIDCLNHTNMSAKKSIDFHGRTANNVVAAAREAGVPTVVCLSIAGAADGEVNHRFGYYQGKAEQERVYRESPLDVRIVRSTQWFEFPASVIEQSGVGPFALVPSMETAPVSADRVAALLVEVAERPAGGEPIVAIRGLEVATLAEFVRRQVAAKGSIAGKSPRFVLELPLFGRAVAHGGLVPDDALVDDATFDEYLASLD